MKLVLSRNTNPIKPSLRIGMIPEKPKKEVKALDLSKFKQTKALTENAPTKVKVTQNKTQPIS